MADKELSLDEAFAPVSTAAPQGEMSLEEAFAEPKEISLEEAFGQPKKEEEKPEKGFFANIADTVKGAGQELANNPAQAATAGATALGESYGAFKAGEKIAHNPIAGAINKGIGKFVENRTRIPSKLTETGLGMLEFAAGTALAHSGIKGLEGLVGVDRPIEEAQQANPNIAATGSTLAMGGQAASSLSNYAKMGLGNAVKTAAVAAGSGSVFPYLDYAARKGINKVAGKELVQETPLPGWEEVKHSARDMALLGGSAAPETVAKPEAKPAFKINEPVETEEAPATPEEQQAIADALAGKRKADAVTAEATQNAAASGAPATAAALQTADAEAQQKSATNIASEEVKPNEETQQPEIQTEQQPTPESSSTPTAQDQQPPVPDAVQLRVQQDEVTPTAPAAPTGPKITKAAQEHAAKLGVDISQVPPTANGSVTKAAIDKFARDSKAAADKAAAEEKAAAAEVVAKEPKTAEEAAAVLSVNGFMNWATRNNLAANPEQARTMYRSLKAGSTPVAEQNIPADNSGTGAATPIQDQTSGPGVVNPAPDVIPAPVPENTQPETEAPLPVAESPVDQPVVVPGLAVVPKGVKDDLSDLYKKHPVAQAPGSPTGMSNVISPTVESGKPTTITDAVAQLAGKAHVGLRTFFSGLNNWYKPEDPSLASGLMHSKQTGEITDAVAMHEGTGVSSTFTQYKGNVGAEMLRTIASLKALASGKGGVIFQRAPGGEHRLFQVDTKSKDMEAVAKKFADAGLGQVVFDVNPESGTIRANVLSTDPATQKATLDSLKKVSHENQFDKILSQPGAAEEVGHEPEKLRANVQEAVERLSRGGAVGNGTDSVRLADSLWDIANELGVQVGERPTPKSVEGPTADSHLASAKQDIDFSDLGSVQAAIPKDRLGEYEAVLPKIYAAVDKLLKGSLSGYKSISDEVRSSAYADTAANIGYRIIRGEPIPSDKELSTLSYGYAKNAVAKYGRVAGNAEKSGLGMAPVGSEPGEVDLTQSVVDPTRGSDVLSDKFVAEEAAPLREAALTNAANTKLPLEVRLASVLKLLKSRDGLTDEQIGLAGKQMVELSAKARKAEKIKKYQLSEAERKAALIADGYTLEDLNGRVASGAEIPVPEQKRGQARYSRTLSDVGSTKEVLRPIVEKALGGKRFARGVRYLNEPEENWDARVNGNRVEVNIARANTETIHRAVSEEMGHFGFRNEEVRKQFEELYNSLPEDRRAAIDQEVERYYENETPDIKEEERHVKAMRDLLPQGFWKKLMQWARLTFYKLTGQVSNRPEDIALSLFKAGREQFVKGGEVATLRDSRLPKNRYTTVTPEEDAAYMDAVKRGDLETAQRMVDEAARAAGYDVEGFHGTKSEFNEFRPSKSGVLGAGIYQARNRGEAEGYSRAWNNEGEVTHEGSTLKLKNRLKNPYTVRTAEEFDRLLKEASNWYMGQDNENVDSVSGYLKSKGYDGIVDDTVGHVLAHEPNQVKRADAVTYDDSGNPIPLSERFNPESPDTRYSRTANVEPEEREERGPRFRTATSEAEANDYLRDEAKVTFDSQTVEQAARVANDWISNGNTLKDLIRPNTLTQPERLHAAGEFAKQAQRILDDIAAKTTLTAGDYITRLKAARQVEAANQYLARLESMGGQILGHSQHVRRDRGFDLEAAIKTLLGGKTVDELAQGRLNFDKLTEGVEAIKAKAAEATMVGLSEEFDRLGITDPDHLLSIQDVLAQPNAKMEDVRSVLSTLLPGGNAARINALVEKINRFYNLTSTELGRQMLPEVIHETYNGQPVVPYSAAFLKKFGDFLKLGNFKGDVVKQKLLETLGISGYDAPFIESLREQIARAQRMPEGQRRNAALLEVQKRVRTKFYNAALKEINQAEGFKGKWDAILKNKDSLRDMMFSAWQAGLLSGPNTNVVNAVSTAISVTIESHIDALARSIKTGDPRYFADNFKGFMSALAGNSATGRGSSSALEAESAWKGKGTKYQIRSMEDLPLLEHIDSEGLTGGTKKLAQYLNLLKNVNRVLSATDAINMAMADTSAQRRETRRFLNEQGHSKAEVEKIMNDLFDPDVRVMDAYKQQAADEAEQHFDETSDPKEKELWMRRRVDELVQDNINKWIPKAQEHGQQQAARFTYNESATGVTGKMVDVTSQLNRSFKEVRYLTPFLRMASKLTDQFLDYTPYGYVRAANKSLGQSAFKEGHRLAPRRYVEGSAEQAAERARATVGTLFFSGIAYMAFSSLQQELKGEKPYMTITGSGPKNPQDRQQMIDAGDWQPYQIRIGDFSMRYTDLPAVSMGLGAIGSFMDAVRYKKSDESVGNAMGAAAFGVVSALFDKNMLQGISNFVDLWKASNEPAMRVMAAKKLGGGIVSGFTNPGMFRWLRNTFDMDKHGDVAQLDQSTLAGWLASVTPFSIGYNTPALNTLGEPIKHPFYSASTYRFADFDFRKPHPIIAPLVKAGLLLPNPAKNVKLRVEDPKSETEVSTTLGKHPEVFRRFVELRGQYLKEILDPETIADLTASAKDDLQATQDYLDHKIGQVAQQAALQQVQEEIAEGKLKFEL